MHQSSKKERPKNHHGEPGKHSPQHTESEPPPDQLDTRKESKKRTKQNIRKDVKKCNNEYDKITARSHCQRMKTKTYSRSQHSIAQDDKTTIQGDAIHCQENGTRNTNITTTVTALTHPLTTVQLFVKPNKDRPTKKQSKKRKRQILRGRFSLTQTGDERRMKEDD